jgi:hypothetical protein
MIINHYKISIHDNELLHLKVQLNLLLKVPCCRFSTIYIFTDNTLKHIREKNNRNTDFMQNKNADWECREGINQCPILPE